MPQWEVLPIAPEAKVDSSGLHPLSDGQFRSLFENLLGQSTVASCLPEIPKRCYAADGEGQAPELVNCVYLLGGVEAPGMSLSGGNLNPGYSPIGRVSVFAVYDCRSSEKGCQVDASTSSTGAALGGWLTQPDMPCINRLAAAAATLGSHVYMAGGFLGERSIPAEEPSKPAMCRLDTRTGQWEALANMEHILMAARLLPSKATQALSPHCRSSYLPSSLCWICPGGVTLVYMFGATNGGTATVQVFDTTQGVWRIPYLDQRDSKAVKRNALVSFSQIPTK